MALAAAISAAGCSGAGHQAASNTTTPPPASGGGSGCRAGGSTGTTTLTLNIDGHQRVVVVHIPASYTGTTRVALVLNLHGSGSTASQQELLTGMDATADRDGFIAAYPQGLISSGSGFDWNVPNEPLIGGSYPPTGSADDVTFLAGLVTQLSGRYCLDLQRVFATGLSGGGRMASQLACDAPSVFAAVAPVAGLRFPSPCPGTRAVPVLAFHGTADPIDPYLGSGQGYWTYSVPAAAGRWASHDGCQTRPQTVTAAGYTVTRYTGCKSGAGVELYTLTGEGHEWPGGPHLPARYTKLLGPQTDAVDANSAMWSFFAAHPNAAQPSG